MLTLGNNIKKYRKGRKITQEQLAEVLGVSDQAVSRWENSTTYPDIELLPTIALYFGVTVDDLMGMEAFKDESDIADILKKRQEFCRKYMINLYFEMWLTIQSYADINCEENLITPEERIVILKKAIELTEFLFEGNYGLNNWQLMTWHEYIARYEAKLKNADAALTHLEAAAKHAIACDTLPAEVSYTSTLLRGETFRIAENVKNYTQTECDMLRSWLKRVEFDFIRNDERFKAIEGIMSTIVNNRV